MRYTDTRGRLWSSRSEGLHAHFLKELGFNVSLGGVGTTEPVALAGYDYPYYPDFSITDAFGNQCLVESKHEMPVDWGAWRSEWEPRAHAVVRATSCPFVIITGMLPPHPNAELALENAMPRCGEWLRWGEKKRDDFQSNTLPQLMQKHLGDYATVENQHYIFVAHGGWRARAGISKLSFESPKIKFCGQCKKPAFGVTRGWFNKVRLWEWLEREDLLLPTCKHTKKFEEDTYRIRAAAIAALIKHCPKP